MCNDEAMVVLITIFTLPIAIIVDLMWGQLNSGMNYMNWLSAAEWIYQHLIPITISGGISAAIAKWVDE